MSSPRVIITGGSQGIGRAIALAFARRGARVAIAARSSDRLDEVVAEIDRLGGKGCPLQMDVTEDGAIEGAVYRAVEHCDGVIDVLVNNAGIFDVQPFDKQSPAGWRRMLDVNLTGPFLVTREVIDSMFASPRGHIFNIASEAARRGFEGNSAYCASKYGLRGFGDAIRLELAPRKIRVSTVYPGATDTTIFDKLPGTWDRSRMNKPEDVAAVVLAAYDAGPDQNVDDLDVPKRQ
ncbi:MAG: SDR family oxidoreductase [Planctomycetes bacterium]|jgi:3-oxoacyl-[acyl-carrier protein] reductase|nr:SDR family oxidoreductase [Planctomycetota bacterium]